jgi:hypothetical protein
VYFRFYAYSNRVSTECWFRNPYLYIRELAEEGITNIVWQRGTLVKRRIDPLKFIEVHYGKGIPVRQILVGDQGAAEVGLDHPLKKPLAVYPVWNHDLYDLTVLEEMMAHPVSERPEVTSDKNIRPDERPVPGQEHRVVVTGIPHLTSKFGIRVMGQVRELQQEYPECIVHFHGRRTWNPAFGQGWGAADIEPRTEAAHGQIILPNGKTVDANRLQDYHQWIRILGMKAASLTVPRNRCIYNIRSAVWAGKHYSDNFRYRSRAFSKSKTPEPPIDFESPDLQYKPKAQKTSYLSTWKKAQPGDKYTCSTCTLSTVCAYFREGAVCTVEGAEPKKLAKYFNTRDSQQIVSGLGHLMAIQTRRLENAIEDENDAAELNPNVTKLLVSLFDQGVKLAKLVDPELRGGTKVQVNVGTGESAAISTGRPKQFIAAIVSSLEAQGIERKDITPELVQSTLAGMTSPESVPRAIEGTVLASRDE